MSTLLQTTRLMVDNLNTHPVTLDEVEATCELINSYLDAKEGDE